MQEASKGLSNDGGQGNQGARPRTTRLKGSTIALIAAAIAAAAIAASIGGYLIFKEILDKSDDGHYEFTESLDREYPAASYTALDVSNVNGYVYIVGDEDTDVIRIDGLKMADSEENLDDIELRITEDDETLVVEVIHEPDIDDIIDYERMNLDIVIPQDMTVRSADIVNGDVEIVGVEFVERAHATNGNIVLEILSLQGNVSVSTTNGDIDVYIVTTLDATVEITTTNGDISLNEVSLDLTMNEPKHVVGVLNSDGYDIDIETVNGDICLHSHA